MLSILSSRLGYATPTVSLEEDNTPPPFPLPNSIQRAKSSAPPSLVVVPSAPSFSFDSPPSSPSLADLDSPPSKLNLLAPTSTTKLAKRVKVSIEPGYSQLDWARLKSSGADLRAGVQQLMRVTPSMLAQHKTRDDCWQSYNGKVYNITPFLKYHPGGPGELMRAAGRDGTELHMKTHAWISIDQMMEGCMVGFMVRDD